MKILKTTIVSLSLLSTLSSAVSFEQNGVKDGNDRVSIGLTSIVHYNSGSDGSGTLYGEYGHFLTDNIELGIYTLSSFSGGDVLYHIGALGNYYFLKTPTLTPYIGAKYYYTDWTKDAYRKDGSKIDYSSNGNDFHIGAHKFFSENLALTSEVGSQFIDFTEYSSTYFNLNLTYFFD